MIARKIAALREEKAKKAFGMLIVAALPWLVRLGKEDGSIPLLFELVRSLRNASV